MIHEHGALPPELAWVQCISGTVCPSPRPPHPSSLVAALRMALRPMLPSGAKAPRCHFSRNLPAS